MFVDARPAGQPGRPAAPVEPAHQPAPAEARPRRQVQLGDVAALVRRQGPPRARHRRRSARPAVVDGAGRAGRHRLRQGHRPQREDQPAQDGAQGSGDAGVEDARSGATPWSATAPAPTSRPTRPPRRCTSPRRRWPRSGPAAPRPGRPFEVPDEAIGCGFTEAVRGVLSHHMVIRDGKIANYHPYPPTPVERQPARLLRHARARTRTRCRVSRSSRRTTATTSRASTSCARCAASIPACPAACTCTSATARPRDAALAHPVRHRRVTPMAQAGTRERRRRRRCARGRASGSRRCSTPARRGRRRGARTRRGTGPRRSPPSTAPASTGSRSSMAAAAHPARCRTRWSPTTWSPACCWCTACTRTMSGRRVEAALDSVRPYLGSHGGDVELLEVADDGVVRLRLLGSCNSCPSSSVTLELAVEDAIEAAAPEVASIEVVADQRTIRRRAGRDPGRGPAVTARTTGTQLGAGWHRVPDLTGSLAAGEVGGLPAVGGHGPAGLPDRATTCSPTTIAAADAAGRWPAPALQRPLGAAVGDAVLTLPALPRPLRRRRAGRAPSTARRRPCISTRSRCWSATACCRSRCRSGPACPSRWRP